MTSTALTQRIEILSPDLVLPAIDFYNIAAAPPLPEDPKERAEFFERLDQRQAIINATSLPKDIWAISNVVERAEELAPTLSIIKYGGATGLMGLLDAHTDRIPKDEAQSKLQHVLIASGPARVSIAFSPFSGAMHNEIRDRIVAKLGYQPIGTALSDTTEFDRQHGIGPKPGIIQRIGSLARKV